MSPDRYERLPLHPLLAATGSTGASLERAGLVTTRQVTRWRTRGIPWPAADRMAVHFGLHPNDIWGDDWWALQGDVRPVPDHGSTDRGGRGCLPTEEPMPTTDADRQAS